MADQRDYPRRTVTGAVWCYADGERLEVAIGNISLGGMLLHGPAVSGLPLATAVTVAFQQGQGPGQTVYLFGRVVRIQPEPAPGVGVRWERAVTWDRDDELRRFIAHTFGLSLIQVTEEPGFAGSRHVYRFRSSLRTPVGIDAPTRIPARPHMPPQRDWGDGAEEHAFGAVSVMLDRRALRFDADLYALLVTDGGLLDCRARTLGASTMVLDVPVSAARGPGAPAQVLLEIQTRDGPVDVGCGCRVVQQVPAAIEGWAGMEMHITATDEGSFPGILQRWLRWAYLRQLAAD